MKKNAQKITKNRSASSSRQFLIELDLKGLIILLFLSLFTGITLFYLGLMFGKATRGPYSQPEKFGQSLSTESQLAEKEVPKDLKIYEIHDETKEKSPSEKKHDDLTKRADALLENATKTLESEAKRSDIDAKKAQAKIELEKTPVKQWPDVKPAKQEVLYTIQILATRQSDKAKGIIKMLKQKGFEAYSTNVSIEGTNIYRVRVGKSDKKSIESLKKRLSKSVKGLGSLSVIKIR